MTDLRVLFVINSLAPGGTETSTLLLVPHLARRGIQTTIVTLRDAEPSLDEEARQLGVEVIRLDARRHWSQVRELRRLIRTRRPDVVHTALFDADLVGRLAAWRTGVAVVSSLVSTPYDPGRLADPLVTPWKLRLVQAVDAVTGRVVVDRFHAVSEGVALANARALHIPRARIRVAERGRDPADAALDADVRVRVRSELGIPHAAPVVLNVGRQEHQKAQVDLVSATPLLARMHRDVVVLIAGREGNASTDIERALRADPAAAAHVHLLGHRRDVPDLLAASDVLAISSRFEGTAGAALEAMALGVPVVATAVDGVRGILRSGSNAVLVPPGHPEALAAGLASVIEDPQLASRLRRQGRHDALERFTLGRAADAMAAIYVDVARKRQATSSS